MADAGRCRAGGVGRDAILRRHKALVRAGQNVDADGARLQNWPGVCEAFDLRATLGEAYPHFIFEIQFQYTSSKMHLGGHEKKL